MTTDAQKQWKDIERIKATLDYNVIPGTGEQYFDGVAKLIAVICKTPLAFVSFIDANDQWYVAQVGVPFNKLPIEETICQFAIVSPDILEIPDATIDSRTRSLAITQTENPVRHYVGIPLVTTAGFTIGTLCAADYEAGEFNEMQRESLRLLSQQVMTYLDTSRKSMALYQELQTVLVDKLEENARILNYREQVYNNLLQAISRSNAVVEFTPDGIILSANAVMLEISGYTSEELIGQHHTLLLTDAERSYNEQFWNDLRTGQSMSGRFQRKRKDGQSFWIQASYSLVLDDNGKAVRVTKIAQDVTPNVNYEHALEQAKQAADQLNEHKDAFIANVSHELRTPLSIILGYTEFLKAKTELISFSKELQAIHSAGSTLLYLVNDILDISKLESGNFRVEHEPFQLNTCLLDVENMLKHRATSKQLDFSLMVQHEWDGVLLGDEMRFKQILLNLIGNAIKFTDQGCVHVKSTITRLANQQIEVQLTIKDTGIGISPEKIESIFNRFQQAENFISKRYGGTGLGLNLCKMLCDKMNGTITVHSELGKGSVFTVTIPFTVADSGDITQPIEYSDLTHSNLKVAIIDDNILNRELLRNQLAEFVHVIYADGDAKHFIEHANPQEPELFLIDLQMPVIDGYQLIHLLKKKHHVAAPIIAMSAHVSGVEINDCKALGVERVLQKPILFHEILKALHEYNKNLPVTPIVSAHQFSLDKLIQLSNNDKSFQQQMVELFISQCEEEEAKISHLLNEENWQELSRVFHKLRSSLSLFDFDTSLLTQGEIELKNNNPNNHNRQLTLNVLAYIQNAREQIQALSYE